MPAASKSFLDTVATLINACIKVTQQPTTLAQLWDQIPRRVLLCSCDVRKFRDRIRVVAPSSGLLAAMLKADRLSGVLRWKINFTEEAVRAEANLAGWDCIWLDSRGVTSERDFIDLSANQMSRADLVGCAMDELITALLLGRQEDRKLCIAWTGWQDLIKADALTAQQIADQLEEAGSNFNAVVLVCDSTGVFSGISELTQG